MIIQFIRLRSNLPEEQLLSKAREREPQFKALPGLLQKYYVKIADPDQYGGIYVWDSPESMIAFRDSELAKGIPQAYEILEAPQVEVLDVLFKLRE